MLGDHLREVRVLAGELSEYVLPHLRDLPWWLGIVLTVGGVCYLVDLLAAFLFPDFGKATHAFIVIPCAIAEITMVLYLLLIGVKTKKPNDERILAAA